MIVRTEGCGVTVKKRIEARDSVKHPTILRTAPTAKCATSVVLRLENPVVTRGLKHSALYVGRLAACPLTASMNV